MLKSLAGPSVGRLAKATIFHRVVTDQTGKVLAGKPAKLISNAARKTIEAFGTTPERVRELVARHIIGSPEQGSILQKVGWSDTLGELGEEVVGGIMRQALGINPVGLPSLEDVGAMSLAFLFNPMAIMSPVASGIQNRINKDLKPAIEIIDKYYGKQQIVDPKEIKPLYDSVSRIVKESIKNPDATVLQRIQNFVKAKLIDRPLRDVIETKLNMSLDHLVRLSEQGELTDDDITRVVGAQMGVGMLPEEIQKRVEKVEADQTEQAKELTDLQLWARELQGYTRAQQQMNQQVQQQAPNQAPSIQRYWDDDAQAFYCDDGQQAWWADAEGRCD